VKKLIWLLTALIVIIFILLLIIFTKLTVHLNYYHHNDNDDLKLEFRIWLGLIKYKINVPLIKIDDNSPSVILKGKTHLGSSSEEPKMKEAQITPENLSEKLRNSKQILEHVIDFSVIVRKFLKKVSIKQLDWHSFVGVGDAAHTGVITGALWAFKGSLIGILSHFISLKEMPNLSVTPHFQLAIIQTQVTCIFQFRLGHAILAGLKMIKFWKGGLPQLKEKTNYQKEKTKSV
jgi:Protein of unknown function (DUF2953)